MGSQLKRRLWTLVIATMAAFCLIFPGKVKAAEVTIESNAYDDHEAWHSQGAAVVFISNQVGYVFYMEHFNGRGIAKYAKTTDGGASCAGRRGIRPVQKSISLTLKIQTRGCVILTALILPMTNSAVRCRL
jgi:hypothetical protein